MMTRLRSSSDVYDYASFTEGEAMNSGVEKLKLILLSLFCALSFYIWLDYLTFEDSINTNRSSPHLPITEANLPLHHPYSP